VLRARILRPWVAVSVCLFFLAAVPCFAQQKGQYVPGQFGFNAGVVPDPGFTYENLALNYSVDTLNNQHGNCLPGITGTYSFWVNENIFMFVPKSKILGGYYAPYTSVTGASGSVVADFSLMNGLNLNGLAGGSGLADTFVGPLNIGWHLKWADLQMGYGFIALTGRFTAGATNNVGSGYSGNNFNAGATVDLTRNRGMTANLFIDYEGHTRESGTNVTPGGAFTMEWGLGQAFPVKKDESLRG